MEELKLLLPGFKVRFDFEFTEEEIKIGRTFGIREKVLESGKFRVYSVEDFGRMWVRWVNYPLPLILIDKFIIDEQVLLDNLNRGYVLLEWSFGAVGFTKQILQILHNESKIFEIYSSEKLLEENKLDFKKILFSLTTNNQISTRIRNITNRLNRSYNEMVVPPWLFESFRLSTTLFVQRTFSSKGDLTPLLTSDSDKELFFAALPYSYSDRFVEQFKSQNEELIKEFINILPLISEKLQHLPSSLSYRDPEKMAYKILEIRENAEVKEVRRELFNIYKRIREYKKGEDEIAQEITEEIKKERKKLSFLNFRIPFKIISGTAAGATAITSNWQLDMFMLPFIIGETYLSVREDIEEKKRRRWVGFFEKFL